MKQRQRWALPETMTVNEPITTKTEVEKSARRWLGTWPATCDACGAYLPDEDYFCDARSNVGPWGLFCPDCHRQYCSGRLGLGSGQKYDSKTLVKLEG